MRKSHICLAMLLSASCNSTGTAMRAEQDARVADDVQILHAAPTENLERELRFPYFPEGDPALTDRVDAEDERPSALNPTAMAVARRAHIDHDATRPLPPVERSADPYPDPHEEDGVELPQHDSWSNLPSPDASVPSFEPVRASMLPRVPPPYFRPDRADVPTYPTVALQVGLASLGAATVALATGADNPGGGAVEFGAVMLGIAGAAFTTGGIIYLIEASDQSDTRVGVGPATVLIDGAF